MPTVVQALGDPLAGDRQRERRPHVGVGLDPRRHLVDQLRLQEVEVLGLAHLEVGAAGDGAARLDEVGGVEHPGAVLALVAAGVRVAAVGAGADDVAVGQEATVDRRVHLLGGALLEVALGLQPGREVLGEVAVLGRRAAPEVVPAQAEPLPDVALHLVLDPAVLRHLEAGLLGRQLSRGAVLVGGADEQHLLAAEAEVAGVDVGRQLRADEVPQVLHAVDVRQRAGDEVPGHGLRRLPARRTPPCPRFRRWAEHRSS